MTYKKLLKYCIVISSILALIFIEIYTHYVQLNNIIDYHLSEVAANFFGLFPLNFLFWFISGKTKLSQVILFPPAIAIGFILYEFIQIFIPWQTFDYYDIFATIASMLLCILINLLMFSLMKKNINKQ